MRRRWWEREGDRGRGLAQERKVEEGRERRMWLTDEGLTRKRKASDERRQSDIVERRGY